MDLIWMQGSVCVRRDCSKYIRRGGARAALGQIIDRRGAHEDIFCCRSDWSESEGEHQEGSTDTRQRAIGARGHCYQVRCAWCVVEGNIPSSPAQEQCRTIGTDYIYLPTMMKTGTGTAATTLTPPPPSRLPTLTVTTCQVPVTC